MKLPLSGRGGTDFRAPLAAIQKLSPKPNICIYTTDGDGQAPDRAPKGMEVVWCIVPTPYGVRPAKWGKLIVVSDDQKLRDPYGV
jgi:predicted metal-dependent peptidase